jgi:hypothetical protein
MLMGLYHKFTDHFPGYLFGYRVHELYLRLSVQDKRTGRAKMDTVNLEATEPELKLAWYKLLKELGYEDKTSQG